MGIVFNGPVASMLMTQPDTVIRPEDFNDAISTITNREQLASLPARMAKYNIPYTTQVKTGETYYTGRALFSALLPDDFYYEGPKGVIIQEGVLTNGVITKAHVGPERNSIVHVMAMNYPVGRVSDFLTDTTFVLNRWFNDYGFSIGISSCLIEDPKFQKEVNRQVEKARLMIAAMGEAPDDPAEAARYDEQILAYIGDPLNVISKEIQSTLNPLNPLNVAALSGAKGKVSNLVQIAAMAGQQHLYSKRMKPEMTYETRCLPYFRSGEDSLEASGFCTSSFLKGLPPSQMYFHTMASREGLFGTAVKTSETGFMHRKAVKVLQDIRSNYDGSIRNFDKTIFEYVYGDDGFAAEKVQMVETKKGKFLSFIDIKNVAGQINARYGFENK